MPASPRIALFALVCTAACHHAEPTTAPGGSGGSTHSHAGGSTSIDAEMVGIASRPGVATKFKLRVDDKGAVVKQSIYHGDAEAIPAAVRSKAEARWPGAAINSYETELYAEHGRVHEVEVKTADGKLCELAVKSDGTDLYEECQVPAESIPAAVAAKVTELFPQGKVVEAETKRGASIDELTVEVEQNGQEFYLRVKPDGTVLAKLVRIPAVFEVPIQ